MSFDDLSSKLGGIIAECDLDGNMNRHQAITNELGTILTGNNNQ